MLRTKEQSIKLNTICSQLKLSDDAKATMVHDFSNGATETSKLLTFHQANGMIKALERMQAETQGTHKKANGKTKYDPSNTMRRKIISICHQMGWYIRDEETKQLVLKNSEPQIDYKAIDKFLTGEKGPFKKALNQHTYLELTKLIYVFERLLKTEVLK